MLRSLMSFENRWKNLPLYGSDDSVIVLANAEFFFYWKPLSISSMKDTTVYFYDRNDTTSLIHIVRIINIWINNLSTINDFTIVPYELQMLPFINYSIFNLSWNKTITAQSRLSFRWLTFIRLCSFSVLCPFKGLILIVLLCSVPHMAS